MPHVSQVRRLPVTELILDSGGVIAATPHYLEEEAETQRGTVTFLQQVTGRVRSKPGQSALLPLTSAKEIQNHQHLHTF